MDRVLTLILAAVLALGIAATAKAAVPLSEDDYSQAPYPTADAAAIAALEASARLSRTLEYAGAVYYTDNGYHFTIPVTSGNAREVEGYRIRITRRGTVVGLYHTHPADLTDDTSERFSSADVETAKAMRLISYVGVIKSGAVIEFDYRHDKTLALFGAANFGARVSTGHPVGRMFTTGEKP